MVDGRPSLEHLPVTEECRVDDDVAVAVAVDVPGGADAQTEQGQLLVAFHGPVGLVAQAAL